MKKIFLITGELSGEIHSKNLVRYLKLLRKDLKFYAVGSNLLKKEGCKIIIDYKEISIIGFLEVLKKIFYLLKVLKRVKKFIKKLKPDIVILVDFPGFNLKIAKYCKKIGIRVVYFIPPQIWAWHYKRIYKIKKYSDFVIPILPFEEQIYKKEHIPAKYFGHPIIENIKSSDIKKNFRENLKIPAGYKIISIFPGSRKQEVEYNLDTILKSVLILQNRIPDLYFILCVAPNLNKTSIYERVKLFGIKNLKIIQNNVYNILNISYAAIVASGTITLEAALFKVPSVVIYNIKKLNYWLAKNFIVKVKFISLPNIIGNKKIVEELVGKNFNPDKIASEMYKILTDSSFRKKMIKELSQVKMKLNKKNILLNIAKKILEFI